ncbi:hypothetical protein PISMIDRAFT_672298 [Pisolithus microcarpus 441]|uniref:Uncharacterized protein n=1 Tax=Pisolithus microcarpus 441 TaxID=765257 RepID=A0A0C9ZUD9_9AGAM|nr:hypothetical protein PISMIDRAFT_672298 [Pisolithus microcarpus 441]
MDLVSFYGAFLSPGEQGMRMDRKTLSLALRLVVALRHFKMFHVKGSSATCKNHTLERYSLFESDFVSQGVVVSLSTRRSTALANVQTKNCQSQ